MIRLFSLPARRHAHNAVSAQVAIMESRTLLSGNAIFPQPASVKPQAATPPTSPTMEHDRSGRTGFHGLNLTQDGTDVLEPIGSMMEAWWTTHSQMAPLPRKS